MKQLTIFLGSISVIIVILFGSNQLLNAAAPQSSDPKTKLVMFNWGDYIDPALIKEFEEQTGYRVIYETFDSNEAMEAKLKQGGTQYDITVPSEFMVEKLAKEELLLPLDHSRIKGLETVSSYLLDGDFDPENTYSIPYFWGSFGILYNAKEIDGAKLKTWEDLWNPEFNNQLLLSDGARETFGIALQTLGYSSNTTDEKELQAAYEKLKQLLPNVKAILTDEIKTYMKINEANLAVAYSGDAGAVMAENPDVRYVIPHNQSNIWTDNLVIPKSSRNPEAAYAFINFMLEPDHAARNSLYVGYATPNEAGRMLLPKELTADQGMYLPHEQLVKMEHYNLLDQPTLERYNELFLTLKMAQ
ncbi:ABC transporter substrate-binding protein [Vagococcus sp. BWB3-3]|uniref:ABC transporter substrate-binding protein n=1 Tax=Vagococcus allomyrinae TaxID=2794353 RepID=A0A940SSF3_9ENTE|nr:ABC transporter substrate-binding protein [Vagococcus allomyrinae]